MMDRRPKVAYVGGWTGKSNLGDEALLPAMQRLFSELALFPFAGGRLSRMALRTLPGLKYGIFGGGTLIGQKGLWLEIAKEFLAQSKQMVMFGTGVEEPSFWPGDPGIEAWKCVLDRCDFLGVRGPISAEMLRQFGHDRVRVVGDPVLAFACDEINHVPNARTLGLNFGTADTRVFGGNETRVKDELVKLATIARQEGWSVEWFVVWPKDLPPTLQAAKESQTEAVIHTLYHDHEAFIQRARPLSVFVGMKLHATLLATCALTPSLMIEYRPKCRDYMQSIGQDAATIRTDHFRAKTAWEIISHWNTRRTETAQNLATGIHALRTEQQRAAKALMTQLTASR